VERVKVFFLSVVEHGQGETGARLDATPCLLEAYFLGAAFETKFVAYYGVGLNLRRAKLCESVI
jgi:hypothetical protein